MSNTIRVNASQLAVLALSVVAFLLNSAVSEAQVRDRSLPTQNYYTGFFEYYSADYGDALKHFTRGADSAFKVGPDRRFLDSACYWTMAGECHYHMGNYAEALVYYEQALELLLTYAKGDWQERIDPKPASIKASTSAIQQAAITWYESARGAAIANLPNSFNVMFGRLDAARAFREGGLVQPAEIRAVDHAEIMRCAALALHRRHTIKGVTCRIDPFTSRLVSGLSVLPTETPIIGKWNLMVIGLANLSAGKTERAAAQINSALQFASGLDHNLTPVGLLALSRIAFAAGEFDSAATLSLEASWSAAVFSQYDLVEESLSLGSRIHLSRSNSVYQPLAPAIQWAAGNKARWMQTSLITRLADCLIESEQADAAAETLSRTRRAMSGTDLGRSILSARIRYLTAALDFMNARDGFSELQRALQEFQKGSLWLFQLALIDSSLASGAISQRQAEVVYEQLLIDPSDDQWKLIPMETMAYLTSAHVASMETWFEILVGRKNHEKAIEVAELIRRHRFFGSLPMAGRLLSLRWILTAPENQLTPKALKQRNAISSRYPKINESVNRIAAIEKELRKLPLNPAAKSDEQRKQQQLFVEQLNHARFLESMFASLALRRQPADLVFPAAAKYSDISKGLNEKQVIIASLQTSAGYHVYVLTQQTRRYLGVIRDRDLKRAIAGMFKEMGISDANNTIDAATLSGSGWKPAAAELKNLIFEEYHDDQWKNYDELVVVPDGILWYVPFEVLQTGENEDEWMNLHEAVKIRYLPVISFASHSRPRQQQDLRMAVVVGKIHPKANPELAELSFEELKDRITNAVQFNGPVKIPSNLLNTVVDSLVVWSDMQLEDRAGPWSLLPFQLDKGRTGSTLGGWMTAPWRGPEKIVLPTLSSGVAGGLKSKSTGNELFLTSCGLLASGVRSALISRWRVGGENSLTLSREFAIRSRTTSAPQAWYDSVAYAREQDLNLQNEIRIKPSKKQKDTFKAEHPFFWAGNMLVDLQGFEAPVDAAEAELAKTSDDPDDDIEMSDTDAAQANQADAGDNKNKASDPAGGPDKSEPESGLPPSERKHPEKGGTEGSGSRPSAGLAALYD